MAGVASVLGRATRLRFVADGPRVCVVDLTTDGLTEIVKRIAYAGPVSPRFFRQTPPADKFRWRYSALDSARKCGWKWLAISKFEIALDPPDQRLDPDSPAPQIRGLDRRWCDALRWHARSVRCDKRQDLYREGPGADQ